MTEPADPSTEYSLDLAFSSATQAYVIGQDMYAVGYGWAKYLPTGSWDGEAQKAEKVHTASTFYFTLFDGAPNPPQNIQGIVVTFKNPPSTPFQNQTGDKITILQSSITQPFGTGLVASAGCNTWGYAWRAGSYTVLSSIPQDTSYEFTVKITVTDSTGATKVFKVDPKMIVGQV
jgi:hypothetical protein